MTFVTWLPRPSFVHSVAELPDKLLEQQCCEALRLLHDCQSGSFEPSVQMWVGREPALALYASLAILEWEARYPGKPIAHRAPYVVNPGYKQEGAEPLFPNPRSEHLGWLPPISAVGVPGWLGRDDIHASHRAALAALEAGAPAPQLVWP